MNKNKTKLLLILPLVLTFPVFAVETFTIKNHGCSSAPASYKIIRAKKPIKINNYTYNYSNGESVENGILRAAAERQVNLEDLNGKVQIIVINDIDSDNSYRTEEYFFNQKVYCITLKKKTCYSMPEELFRSAKESDSFGIQWLCPNHISTNQKPTSIHQEQYVGSNTTIGGSTLKPIYESGL